MKTKHFQSLLFVLFLKFCGSKVYDYMLFYYRYPFVQH